MGREYGNRRTQIHGTIENMNSVIKQQIKVLIISYYFPPLGMGGVQRVSKFVKYLPSFDWEPVVLTVKDIEYFSQDPSLLDELPEGLKIHRTCSLDPLRLIFIFKKIFKRTQSDPDPAYFGTRGGTLRIKKNKKGKWFGSSLLKLINFFSFPDNKIGWFPFALLKGLRLCKNEKIDLLFTTSPPLTSHLTGFFLKIITGIKWVADYRDSYLTYEDLKNYSPLKKFFIKCLQKLFLKKADGVIAINQSIASGLKGISADIKNVEVITNGYDQTDFDFNVEKSKDIFRIIYFGTFSPDCPAEPFLKALHILLQQNKIPVEKIRFTHIGLSMGIDLERSVEKYELKEITELKGYRSHKEGVRELLKSNLALLSVAESAQVITTGKIFEYLGAKIPILAIVPTEGEAGRLTKSLGAGRVISPSNITGIEDAILTFYREFEGKSSHLKIYPDEVERYEKKYLTSKLAQLFNEVVKN
ncbi:MAG: hypothetical protein OEV55_05265 [candidate division Zixibacteria bacterium]|nr:hypothetical protein [candidate division Zixibacteria bacterium]